MRKFFSVGFPPRPQKKPEGQRYEIFFSRNRLGKKKSVVQRPTGYQNHRNSIGKLIGGVFGRLKSAWTKLLAKKGSKMAFFRFLGPKYRFQKWKNSVAPPAGRAGEKIFENFLHKKEITGNFRVRGKKIFENFLFSRYIFVLRGLTPKRGGRGGPFRGW